LAVPDQQFDDILENIEKTVKETISKALSQQSSYPYLVNHEQLNRPTSWDGKPLGNHIVSIMLANICSENPFSQQQCGYVFQRADELVCPNCGMFRQILLPQTNIPFRSA